MFADDVLPAHDVSDSRVLEQARDSDEQGRAPAREESVVR